MAGLCEGGNEPPGSLEVIVSAVSTSLVRISFTIPGSVFVRTRDLYSKIPESVFIILQNTRVRSATWRNVFAEVRTKEAYGFLNDAMAYISDDCCLDLFVKEFMKIVKPTRNYKAVLE
ncbi:hypothetical protein ANN_23122 [Periplaneta americana]|uniref:Uncharacterized protein n=1 Tax=Periplaneta americana TaxID=6978 RepID=A0ABQ8SK80_PERAM|nr:hypothetical protein ANN_23122 [Periplaneta americana]